MKYDKIYSIDDIARTYKEVPDHIETRRHISRYSENPHDIREIALRGLDMKVVKTALDLGCAYGFFTEKLSEYLKKGSYITGIDIIDEGNRSSFLQILDNSGCEGRFVAGNAEYIQTMQSGSFDLIVASYSLYFFPHLIGEIARVLKPGGVFIALTHSEESLKEIIKLIPMPDNAMKGSGEAVREPAISRLLRVFSMENGEGQLKEYFGRVETISYSNKLIFPHEKIDDCFDYVSKKRDLLFKEVIDADPGGLEEAMKDFFSRIKEYALKSKVLEITKNDCIFRCYSPKKLRGHS